MLSSNQALLGVDYLIYSSHKSGTQTLLSTLRKSGLASLHLHSLANLGLQKDKRELLACLQDYKLARSKRLTILSTFRDPLERHISSFFQWHGLGVVRNGFVQSTEDTVIARLSLTELAQLFVSELQTRTLIGYRESLHQLCQELSLPVSAVSFNPERAHGRLDSEWMQLITFRFDSLFASYPGVLQQALNTELRPVSSNRSSNHWYHETFAAFRESVKLPQQLIADVYTAKKDLIDIFYPGQFDTLVRTAQARYSA